MKTTGVLDIGYGNINSVIESLKNLEIRATPVRDPDIVSTIDNLIVPGVGSFGAVSTLLEQTGNGNAILKRHINKLPTLGICLGFQLFCMSSEEDHSKRGLGIFEYSFKKLPSPQIGWRKISHNTINAFSGSGFFYFNHGFGAVVEPGRAEVTALNSEGLLSFAISEATVGVQFHPERSQKAGQAFLNWFFEGRQE